MEEGGTSDVYCSQAPIDFFGLTFGQEASMWSLPLFQKSVFPNVRPAGQRVHSLLSFGCDVRWADLPCDVMEERERAGERVGRMGPVCLQVHSRQKTCTIQPLRMNCYKLWLEVPSQLGPIRSKPVYLSPIDHGKHHASVQRSAFMCFS